MATFDESWWEYFVPECYFDTVLVKKLLECDKRLYHRKGCNNVVNELKNKRLKDFFAVAVIDKDKKELDYLKECSIIYDNNKLLLHKHKSKSHFIIQLNPPLEKWVIDILDENGLKIEDFGYSKDYKGFKKEIKSDIDSENDKRLKKLVNAIITTNCQSVRVLKHFLLYLKEKNYQVDINELING